MNINSISISNSTPVNTSFNGVKLYSGADKTLKNVLTRKEWLKFEKIVDERALDECVNLHFYGNDSLKKLSARIAPIVNGMKSEKFQMKDYNQGLFQSAISFIEKMNKRAALAERELINQPVVDIDNIIAKTK